MHPRNPYHLAPDFKSLAHAYPALSKYIHGHTIDFHNDQAQRCLTQALLKRDFKLTLELPLDRLCPPVPNRLNYVLWIQDVVAEFRNAIRHVCGSEGETRVRGLDIGTGASAIYPLLACSLEKQWKFIATELDDYSYTHAQANVHRNELNDRICVLKVDSSTAVGGVAKEAEFSFNVLFGSSPSTGVENGVEIQFTMCNPPFYNSAEDIAQSEAGKEEGAFGVCTGAPIEMITDGGEVAFVGAMVRESVHSGTSDGYAEDDDGREGDSKRRRVANVITQSTVPEVTESASPVSVGPRWYTSMLGKMGSVVEVVNIFREVGVTNYAITEFVQGHTRRWAVGWCVGPWRLSDDLTRIPNPNSVLQRLLPPHNTLHFRLTNLPHLHHLHVTNSTDELVAANERLENVLRGIEGAVVTPLLQSECDDNGDPGPQPDSRSGSGFAVSVLCDTWSRSARRKRKRDDASYSSSTILPPGEVGMITKPEPELVCVVSMSISRPTNGESELEVGVASRTEMEVRWMYGKERRLLESFASHIAKRVSNTM